MRSLTGTSIGSHPCRMTTSKRGSAVLNARWLGSASRLSSPTPTLPLPACWRLVLTVMCRRSVLSFAPTLRPSTPCERHSWSCERPRWSRDGKHARVSPPWALAWHRSPRYSRRSEAWSQGEVRLRAADRPAGRITELRLALAEAIAGVSSVRANRATTMPRRALSGRRRSGSAWPIRSASRIVKPVCARNTSSRLGRVTVTDQMGTPSTANSRGTNPDVPAWSGVDPRGVAGPAPGTDRRAGRRGGGPVIGYSSRNSGARMRACGCSWR